MPTWTPFGHDIGASVKDVALAERMLARARAWAQGVSAGWVTGDTVYGHDGAFRRFLEGHRQAYLLAVPANQPLFDGEHRSTVKAVAEGLPAAVWGRASAGDGSKGLREYDWAVRAFGPADDRGWQLWLVVRRHRERADERAYYFARGPAATAPAELVRVAGGGVSGTAEGRLRARRVRGAVVGRVAPARDAEPVRPGGGGRDPGGGRGGAPAEKGGAGLVRVSVPEVRRLLLRVVWAAVPDAEKVLAWSAWRRAHQHRARRYHYRKRGAKPPD